VSSLSLKGKSSILKPLYTLLCSINRSKPKGSKKVEERGARNKILPPSEGLHGCENGLKPDYYGYKPILSTT